MSCHLKQAAYKIHLNPRAALGYEIKQVQRMLWGD